VCAFGTSIVFVFLRYIAFESRQRF